MKQHKRNIRGILKSAKEKNKNTLLHIESTLKNMIKQKQIITFSHVAKCAEVSRSCLYKNSKIRKKIETIRQQQNKKTMVSTALQPAKSETTIVANLKKQVKKLQLENKKLRKQLETVYGRMIE